MVGQFSLIPQNTEIDELAKAIEIAGYSYDPKQDIFYSTIDPWQRNVGYCRLYDEAAAPMGMIIDTEPIYFEYDEKKWMIGLWKGQYDLVTGCEIGVYTGAFELAIPGAFSGTFYTAVSNDDLLPMSFVLKKNGQVLFTREDKHWWLTGFRLGEFSEPWELTMDINITLPNEIMRNAFVSGLRNAGYSDHQFLINDTQVSFTFDKPFTPQPFTRTAVTDQLIQRKNKLLCDMYQDLTASLDNIEDKLAVIMEQSPEIYKMIMYIGKDKQLYELAVMLIMLGALLITRFAREMDNEYEMVSSSRFSS